MKKYVFIKNNIAQEIIPEFVDIFPGVPVKERYTKDFLDQCVVVDESTEVEQNWEYDPETNTFKEVEEQA